MKAEAVGAPKVTVPLTGGKVYFGSQDWYIVGMGDTGPVPGPSKTVTLFADSNIEDQYVSTSINYSEGDLCTAMKNLGASLNLSAQAQSLISSRTLTAADEITGDSVTTPFWPLSKSEFEAIQAENSSLLTESSRTGCGHPPAQTRMSIRETPMDPLEAIRPPLPVMCARPFTWTSRPCFSPRGNPAWATR